MSSLTLPPRRPLRRTATSCTKSSTARPGVAAHGSVRNQLGEDPAWCTSTLSAGSRRLGRAYMEMLFLLERAPPSCNGGPMWPSSPTSAGRADSKVPSTAAWDVVPEPGRRSRQPDATPGMRSSRRFSDYFRSGRRTCLGGRRRAIEQVYVYSALDANRILNRDRRARRRGRHARVSRCPWRNCLATRPTDEPSTQLMDLDAKICYCFHVSRRKLVNFVRQTQPKVPSQLSQCGGAGTGCGWCIPFLKQIFEQAARGGDDASWSNCSRRGVRAPPRRLHPRRQRDAAAGGDAACPKETSTCRHGSRTERLCLERKRRLVTHGTSARPRSFGSRLNGDPMRPLTSSRSDRARPAPRRDLPVAVRQAARPAGEVPLRLLRRRRRQGQRLPRRHRRGQEVAELRQDHPPARPRLARATRRTTSATPTTARTSGADACSPTASSSSTSPPTRPSRSWSRRIENLGAKAGFAVAAHRPTPCRAAC